VQFRWNKPGLAELRGKRKSLLRHEMSTDEDVLDGGSVDQKPPELMTATEHFMARKFKEARGMRYEKRAILKATGTSISKKQNISVNSYVKEVLQDLVYVDTVIGNNVHATEDLMELSNEGLVVSTNSLETMPKHLTGVKVA
jgi:hypothetical protein